MPSLEDPARVDSMRQALAEYLDVPGIKAAMLVSDQGLVVSCAARDHVDTASIAALVIDTVATAQRFGLQVEAGFLETMTIEFKELTIVLAPFTPDVMLALVVAPGALGSLVGPGAHARTHASTPAPAARGGADAAKGHS